MSIIEIKNLGKKYNITHQRGGYVALRDVLMNVIKSPFSFLKSKAKQVAGVETKEEFWALKDINLEIQKGEVVGIIGANGAGKSTLLKILSQITPPTTGEIKIHGSVGSLLEVGTGFHPELTGRENIFLNGAILGMTRGEMAKKFDAIVEFAGIDKFLDTPVKYYSSGMYVRLAFSVAAHMEPDILIIDEVLAVGDAEFQKKCLGKMEEVTKEQGRTILFVSHNMGAIQSLCNKCILVQNGALIKEGEPAEIIDLYLNGQEKNRHEVIISRKKEASVQVTKMRLENNKGELISEIELGHDSILKIEYCVNKEIHALNVEITLLKDGIPVFCTVDSDEEEDILMKTKQIGEYRSTVILPTSSLKEGRYEIKIGFGDNRRRLDDIYNQKASLDIDIRNSIDDLTQKSYRKDRVGLIYKKVKWETESKVRN